MKQLYLCLLLFISLSFLPESANAQVSNENKPGEATIEQLSIYPNPATGEKVYITTKTNQTKRIEIFNVLGKPVLSTSLSGTELNISSLESGIYILKIKEGKNSATRKLVIR